MKKLCLILSFTCLTGLGGLVTRAQVSQPQQWFEAGSGVELPKELTFANANGRLGILNADGPVNTKGQARVKCQLRPPANQPPRRAHSGAEGLPWRILTGLGMPYDASRGPNS